MSEVEMAAVSALPGRAVKSRGSAADSGKDFVDALRGNGGKRDDGAKPSTGTWANVAAKLNAVLNGARGLSGGGKETADTLSSDEAPNIEGEVVPPDALETAETAVQSEGLPQESQAPLDMRTVSALKAAQVQPIGDDVAGLQDMPGAIRGGSERFALPREAAGQPALGNPGGAVASVARNVPAGSGGPSSTESGAIRPELVRQVQETVRPGHMTTEPPPEAGRQNGAAASQAGPKVIVLGTQNIPALPLSITTSHFIENVTSASTLSAATSARAGETQSTAHSNHAAVQTLKIQLQPAELGTVTANLRLSGEQLSVELKVENAEAYHRLSKDAEVIVKTFRAMGFDIDQVSIQQPSSGNQGQRLDAGSGGTPGFFREPGSSHGGTSKGGGGQGSDSASTGMEHTDAEGSPHESRSARGLYI